MILIPISFFAAEYRDRQNLENYFKILSGPPPRSFGSYQYEQYESPAAKMPLPSEFG